MINCIDSFIMLSIILPLLGNMLLEFYSGDKQKVTMANYALVLHKAMQYKTCQQTVDIL